MTNPPGMDKATLLAIIKDAIREELGGAAPTAQPIKRLDPSGVIGIDAPRVPLEPFPFEIREQSKVKLVDLTTVEESPRLGCGLMEMDQTWFEWTLTYDEVDYVIDGTLDIVVDGRTTRATAGQVIYVPKDTKIRFSTPDKVRFFYVVYPANWAES